MAMEMAIFESRAWPFRANLAKIMAIFEICPILYEWNSTGTSLECKFRKIRTLIMGPDFSLTIY
jgi:hypothetical protein